MLNRLSSFFVLLVQRFLPDAYLCAIPELLTYPGKRAGEAHESL